MSETAAPVLPQCHIATKGARLHAATDAGIKYAGDPLQTKHALPLHPVAPRTNERTVRPNVFYLAWRIRGANLQDTSDPQDSSAQSRPAHTALPSRTGRYLHRVADRSPGITARWPIP